LVVVSFIINTNNGLKQKVIVFRHCGYFDKEFKNITQLTSFNFTPITLTNGTVSNLIRLTNEKICFLENIDGVLTVRTFEPKTNIITNFLETNLDNNIDGELMSVDNEKSLFVNRKGEIFKLDFINSTTSKLQTVNADLLNTDSNGVIIGLFEVFENVKGNGYILISDKSSDNNADKLLTISKDTGFVKASNTFFNKNCDQGINIVVLNDGDLLFIDREDDNGLPTKFIK